jgi:hypothetical protein
MGWARKSVPAKNVQENPALVGVDLNATCARAVRGPAQVVPSLVALDGAHDDLPMVLSLDGRHPQLGRTGSGLTRQAPHLACSDFLAFLGDRRQWSAGRHRLDATRAMALVFERFQPVCADCRGLVLALPVYLTPAQATLLTPLATQARLPLLGSVRAPLACALTAHAAEPWTGIALVVDADDHAFSATAVVADGEQLWVHATQTWPHLSLRNWKERLLNAVADRCIRQSRRDPRDSAPAEQSLYEQLEDAMDRCEQGQMIELLIQTASWYQNLLLRPEDLVGFCDRLVQQVLEGIQALVGTASVRDLLQLLIVTRAVGRLPGLLPALQGQFRPTGPVPVAEPQPSEDFGEDLLQATGQPARIALLTADAVARAAHDLAARFQSGELPRGHLDLALPLPRGEGRPAADSPKRSFRILSADP